MHTDNLKIVVACGSFDPLHNGHVHYLNQAKRLGDRLVIALETDNCIIRKHGISFMNWEERAPIMKALAAVDEVIIIANCNNPYIDALTQLRRSYSDNLIIFTSGNEPNEHNSPVLKDLNVKFEYNVGSDVKVSSSTEILRRYSEYVGSMKEMESSPYRRYI